MKKICALAALTMVIICSCTAAENAPKAWNYVNALDLRIINKGWNTTTTPYTRLPAVLEDSVRPTLWERQSCSAGIGVRFATNSKRVGVKYQLTYNTHMIHMADTGLKGTDLYIFEGDSVWRHVNTNRPNLAKDTDPEDKIVENTYINNLDGKMHEFMIYLPLYDGVENLWVKVDSGAVITSGRPKLIDVDKKIVAYGTSIMQGGCASRTGMASTNILSRELNCEIVNLGFSGEGKMDQCMARAMAQIEDADMFILDPVPNCTEMMCDTLTYDFVNILRKARPDVPIVMVEGPIYPYARYDSYFGSYLPAKNAAFRRNYERLKAENPDNLYYVDSVNLDGVEDDGTVDGIHLTDLGFRHYANKLRPVLQSILDKQRKKK
ncbi:MAG: SGNH/GDSL hydrolase family protein [Muribaculaceae bacterium]|nr:SGNH/GDSL hydrolase family protein [Muribaculaceae bacterium]